MAEHPTKERSRQSWAHRQERERRRDAFRELAVEAAEHTASGDLTSVAIDDDGELRFARLPEVHRCSCGLTQTPMPQPHSRFGMLPIWVCGVCSLQFIVELSAKLEEHVAKDRPE